MCWIYQGPSKPVPGIALTYLTAAAAHHRSRFYYVGTAIHDKLDLIRADD